jgi:hypothetical protein
VIDLKGCRRIALRELPIFTAMGCMLHASSLPAACRRPGKALSSPAGPGKDRHERRGTMRSWSGKAGKRAAGPWHRTQAEPGNGRQRAAGRTQRVIDGWLARSAPPGKARQGEERPDGWTAANIFSSEAAGEANRKIVVFKLVVEGSILTASMLFTWVGHGCRGWADSSGGVDTAATAGIATLALGATGGPNARFRANRARTLRTGR